MAQEYQNQIVDSSLLKLKLRQMSKLLQEQKNMLFDAEHHQTLLQSVYDK